MAMLGTADYLLCEACEHFDSDGIDGNHPWCSKQRFRRENRFVPLTEECPFGFEHGVPSGYPVHMPRNERRSREAWDKLQRLKRKKG